MTVIIQGQKSNEWKYDFLINKASLYFNTSFLFDFHWLIDFWYYFDDSMSFSRSFSRSKGQFEGQNYEKMIFSKCK